MDAPIPNEEIVEKCRKLTFDLLPRDRQIKIKKTASSMENLDSVTTLISLLSQPFKLHTVQPKT